METVRNILESGLAELGIRVTDEMLGRFDKFADLLRTRSEETNLTAIKDPAEIARLHFIDSAAPLALFDFSDKSVIDIGAGAGFPGLAIKLASPETKITLLDSRQKRVDFLNEAARHLELFDVSAVCGRAEELSAKGKEYRESFDIAISRAVAALPVLCELCLPFVKLGGVFIAMKGPEPEEEIVASSNAIKKLGGVLYKTEKYNLPGTEIGRSCVIIRKETNTPDTYPRRFAKITKLPL